MSLGTDSIYPQSVKQRKTEKYLCLFAYNESQKGKNLTILRKIVRIIFATIAQSKDFAKNK